MPLINGQKMACEPCIRGHRSTKCTHANERLMVPVRKPGRPLSACPHPASRPCTCNAITAAIPRKQKCSCGSSSQVKIDSEDNQEHVKPLPGSTATSPSIANFRVEKSTKVSSSRKPSVDLNALERMDPTQINLLSSSDVHTPTSATSPNGDAFHIPYAAQIRRDAHAIATNGFTPQTQPQQTNFVKTEASDAGADGELRANGSSESHSQADAQKGSCCSTNGNAEPSGAAPAKPTAPSSAKSAQDCCVKSCCAPKIRTPQAVIPLPAYIPNGVHMNGLDMPAAQAPMMMASGSYPIFQQPTIFAYPPQLGSFMQPLQPEQWKQVMATMNFNQQVQATQAAQIAHNNGIAGTGPLFNSSNGADAATLHECNCGPGCECVGCAAHPYNQATTDYVRSARSSLMESRHNQSRVNGTNGQSSIHPDGATTHQLDTSVNGNTAISHGDGAMSPSAAHTPSDTASIPEDQQQLSANDFFFVTYPFDDACIGDTASCPCGDSCECIGCVIHNNPSPANSTERNEAQKDS